MARQLEKTLTDAQWLEVVHAVRNDPYSAWRIEGDEGFAQQGRVRRWPTGEPREWTVEQVIHLTDGAQDYPVRVGDVRRVSPAPAFCWNWDHVHPVPIQTGGLCCANHASEALECRRVLAELFSTDQQVDDFLVLRQVGWASHAYSDLRNALRGRWIRVRARTV